EIDSNPIWLTLPIPSTNMWTPLVFSLLASHMASYRGAGPEGEFPETQILTLFGLDERPYAVGSPSVQKRTISGLEAPMFQIKLSAACQLVYPIGLATGLYCVFKFSEFLATAKG